LEKSEEDFDLLEELADENPLYEDENLQEFYEKITDKTSSFNEDSSDESAEEFYKEITDKTSSFNEDSSEESVEENLLYENENLQEFNKEIANKALDFNEISQNMTEFLPYFENSTSALLFCWIQKHNICKIYWFIWFFKFLIYIHIDILI